MAAHYYIYYRISPDHAELAPTRVHAMQDELRLMLGVRGRYLTKRDETLLKMEIYEAVSDTAQFESALHAMVKKHRLEDLLPPGTTRHIECFED